VTFIERLERFQRKIFRYAFFCCDVIPLGINSLRFRRLEFDTNFIFKLLNNLIDAPDFFVKIPFASPSFNSRNPVIFKIILTQLTMDTQPP